MEVRSQQSGGPDDIRRRLDQARKETIRETRKHVSDARKERLAATETAAEEAREARKAAARENVERTIESAPKIERSGGDAIELSPVARASSDEGTSAERIREIKAAVADGSYLTDERREKAAESMLTPRDA